MKFVIGGGVPHHQKIDSALAKAVARADCWFEDMGVGRAMSMVELARREASARDT
jgi:hypothetical protein